MTHEPTASEQLCDSAGPVVLPPHVIPAWPALAPSAKAVLIAVAGALGGRRVAYLNAHMLTRRSGIRRRATLAKALAELLEKGLIHRKRRFQRCAVYSWPASPAPIADPPGATPRHPIDGGRSNADPPTQQ